jgi:hypothetical protein
MQSPSASFTTVTLLLLPASISGNEAALRFGPQRAIVVIMVTSAVVAGFIGLVSTIFLLALVLIYGMRP